jgi:hypothetical protein
MRRPPVRHTLRGVGIMNGSRRAVTVLVTLAAVMLLVLGGAMLLLWAVGPETSMGDLFDRIRPYLPVQYG